MEHRFIVVTDSEARFGELGAALAGLGTPVWLHWNTDILAQLVGSLGTAMVFVEFAEDTAAKAAELTQSLLSAHPRLWVLGFARHAEPARLREAMRAGARDFIDLRAPVEEIRRAVESVLDQAPPLPPKTAGHMITFLGARPGVGTTTAAVNLALLLKQEFLPDERILLLDFGYPTGDASLCLDTKVGFNFCDAVRSLRRFDNALLNTAFAHHKSGIATLSLPYNLAELRDISPADAMTLLSLFKSYFKVVVVDLGGFAGMDLLMYALGISDQILMVCEQSLPAVFSARQLLHNLHERNFASERLGLVVGKYDARIAMTPAQMALNLQLRLIENLPQRTEKLICCFNMGKSLLEVAPKDPYLEALRRLGGGLRRHGEAQRAAAPAPQSLFGRWLSPLLNRG